jgi:hypothetical protein
MFTPSLYIIWQTLRTNIEEFNDDLKGQPLGLRNPKYHKNKSQTTNYGINPKNTPKPNGIQHHREGISDNDITDPEGESTNCNANSTHTGREDLRTEDVGYRPDIKYYAN